MPTTRATRAQAKAASESNKSKRFEFGPDVRLVFSDTGFLEEEEKVAWASIERQKAVYERALEIIDHDYGSDADKLQCTKLMAVLEPRVYPCTFEQTFNHMGSWLEAAWIVGQMDGAITAAHRKSFSAEHTPAPQQHTRTDTTFVSSFSDGNDMHLPMFQSLWASIPDRARLHVGSQVLPEERVKPGDRDPSRPHVSRWGVQKVLKPSKTKAVRSSGPLIAAGDKSSEQQLFQQVKMFDKLSDSDKLPVTMVMFERWLGSTEASEALSTWDREAGEAIRKLLRGLKKYYGRRQITRRLENGSLSVAVAREFGRLSHWDKTVVMGVNIQHWKYQADRSLSRHLSRFDTETQRLWAHDWSKNCATKINP